MRRSNCLLLFTFATLGLPGCVARTVARTVVSAVTLPVKVASKGADVMTTSQSEADQKRGRQMRLHEERIGRLERSYRLHTGRCGEGDHRSCDLAEAEYDEIQRISSAQP